MSELSRVIMVVNALGLHARAASKLVQLAGKFSVDVKIAKDDLTVNAKSIMGVLMLAAAKGTEVTVTATGDEQQAKAALDAIAALFADRFGEDR